MSRLPKYPAVDPRRVGQLRNVLLRDIAAMAPRWRGAAEVQGPDRTIIEVAARLSEEATKRMDKTPERDALAFLDMFDIAPPQPVAARGVTVFALKDGQSSPVWAKARAGVTIATQTPEGQTAAFETTEDLRIQPGRITHLATVDPARDTLGIAPQAVTTFDPDLTEQPIYQLSTAAGAGDRILSVYPPVGIVPGDLLRIARHSGAPLFVEVASMSEDGLIQLAEPLDVGLSVEDIHFIERMQRLDAFDMPDEQEHALYVGDVDVLAVKEPAIISLRFDPPQVAEILAADGAIFEVWGTRETPIEEDAPAWHPLVRLASASGDLQLYKGWIGPVDEVEVAGHKSRWIRIKPRSAIKPSDDENTPLLSDQTTVVNVTLGIQTAAPESADNETISQVAYNASPLSAAAPFLPFGPEPLRFDTFAIAAPEAFTKEGATATLDFTLMDGTMLAMTQSLRFDGRRHVYGIGSNGRLQVLDLTEETVTWSEVTGPPVEAGSDQTLEIDSDAGLLAYVALEESFGSADDIVIVTTTSGARFAGYIERRVGPSQTEPATLGEWFEIPEVPVAMLAPDERPGFAVSPQKVGVLGRYTASLYVAMQSGVQSLHLPSNGNATGRLWSAVGEVGAPTLPISPYLTYVANEDGAEQTWVLSSDENGQVWALNTGLSPAVWTALVTEAGIPFTATNGSQAVGLVHGAAGSRRLAVATLTDVADERHLTITQYNVVANTLSNPETRIHGATSFGTDAVLAVSGAIDFSAEKLPHVFGLHLKGDVVRSFEWAPKTDRLSQAAADSAFVLPEGATKLTAGMFLPVAPVASAKQVFAATDQTTVSLDLNPSTEARFADWIDVPTDSVGSHVLVTRVSSATGERELLISPDMVARNGPGDDVAAFDVVANNSATDWDQDVFAFRAGGEIELDYESGGDALVATSGADISTLAGRSIIVIPDNAPDTFEIFDVQTTGPLSLFVSPAPIPDHEALQVTDFARLNALMNGGTVATIREVVLVNTIVASADRSFAGTLINLGGLPFSPTQISGFETSTDVLPVVEALTDSFANAWVIINALAALAPPNATLIKLVTSGGGPEMMQATSLTQSYSNPELSWEYFDGEGWKRLDDGFRDTTADFASTGFVSFTVPRNLAMAEISGQEDYWIRARLVGGDYGRPRYIVESSATTQEVIVQTDHMRPPEVARVSARVDLPPTHLPQHIIARNNMRDLDQTSANRLDGAAFAMFEGAFEVPLGQGGRRALLLGFTEPLEPGTVTLFVTAIDHPGRIKMEIHTLGADTEWSPAPLTGVDPTNGLLRSGLISVSITERPAQVQMFGKTLYWMRLQPVVYDVDWAPKITGMWLNGVSVVQAETVRQELLGGSQGEPNLVLELLKPPVLAGSLELRVRERLDDEEIAALAAVHVAGDPDQVVQAPNLRGDWVLWQQVPSLTDQPPNARVYVLDANGQVRFGDGQNGRIVLAGRDNIRAFSYQSGGQRIETAAFADAKPRGSIEGLETILAPAPIAGGSQVPEPAELIARMPHVVRHAGAALSLSDIEALAQDADSQIMQAKAFSPERTRNAVLLVVLARGKERLPVYSLAQRDALRGVLAAHMTDAFRPGCLNVVSATFVPVKVSVELIAKTGARAALENAAKTLLDRFLHAAEGGPEGRGWPPGRALWANDVRRALSDVETLDRILTVKVIWPDERGPETLRADEVIATAATRDITVNVVGEAAL